ncbi:MAG: calcium/sodium antiporter [Planctomycetota bacterium]
MNILWAIVLLFGGLVILWKCAGFLVAGAVGLAERLGVSQLVVGLTVVAMGTSAPEVAASIAAVLRAGGGDIAIGNVYGSNIANLALVGGLAALIRPISVQGSVLRREMPVMLLVALLLWPVLGNLSLSRLEGAGLLGVFAILILLTVQIARKQEQKGEPAGEQKGANETRSMQRCILFIVIGLVGLALGAKMTVEGAVFIGKKAGLSEAVIGLTIIAIGTSLPELATCLVAAIKGQDEISIGNLVGSNIFNTLLVVGVAGVIRPFEIVQRLAGVDYWIMIVVSVVFIAIALIGRRIGRIGAVILFGGYISYIVYLLGCSGQ